MSTSKTSDDCGPTEFREDDTWFSPEQMAQLSAADRADALQAPIPTQMVSNGE